MKGILYGVGVGPGDPELMTLKAVRLIRENDVIALPGREPVKTTAYRIAAGAVPEIRDKELLGIHMPMGEDPKEQARYHREGANRIESCLKEGRNVVFLTLGDVTIYSTFTYIQQIVRADGYRCVSVCGVPSFCAAAAALGMSLGMGKEQIHICPDSSLLQETIPERGTVILMKSGNLQKPVKEQLKQSGRDAVMVENCGMEGEAFYDHLDEIPDTAGYFSTIISKS